MNRYFNNDDHEKRRLNSPPVIPVERLDTVAECTVVGDDQAYRTFVAAGFAIADVIPRYDVLPRLDGKDPNDFAYGIRDHLIGQYGEENVVALEAPEGMVTEGGGSYGKHAVMLMVRIEDVA